MSTGLDHASIVHFDDLMCAMYCIILCYMFGK